MTPVFGKGLGGANQVSYGSTVILLRTSWCDVSGSHFVSDITYVAPDQGWICGLPGARENITVCGVASVPASTHRVS